jgi:CHASE3 domain sensor protein
MEERQFKMLRWMPVAASVGVLVLIVIVSATTIRELRQATHWRRHTFQAILEAQSYEDTLINAQNHVRRYLAKGAPNLLIEYRNDTDAEANEFEQLTNLTSDTPELQERLRELHTAIKAVFDYEDRVIGVYARQGTEAAFKLEESGEGGDILDTAIGNLEKFKAEEQRVLNDRDLAEQAGYRKAALWLILGGVMAALLLVVSNYVGGREMARRRRAEVRQKELIAELQQALAEVKTLSGLIPICGWCKKVRNDTGYWQGVEHYIAAHADVVFSHGICPDCAKKFEEEIREASKNSNRLQSRN